MNRKQRRAAKGKNDPTTTFPMAAPPHATPATRDLTAKLIKLLEPVKPEDKSSKALAEMHEAKALALWTVAAFYLSQIPGDEYRQTLLDRADRLLRALVRDNDAARRGLGTAETIRPGATKH